MKRHKKIIIRKGLVRWYYNIVAANGQTTSNAQKYFSKPNAVRAARREATDLGLDPFKDVVIEKPRIARS